MVMRKEHIKVKSRKLYLAIIAYLLTSFGLHAEMQGAAWYFSAGHTLFEQGQYADAIAAFNQAVEKQPFNSNYHHWLGKSYGRLAEISGWFKAMDLSRKTLAELELAVELDENNTAALVDLMAYYEQAPAFLGGNQEKANEIQKKLDKIQTQNMSQSLEEDSDR